MGIRAAGFSENVRTPRATYFASTETRDKPDFHGKRPLHKGLELLVRSADKVVETKALSTTVAVRTRRLSPRKPPRRIRDAATERVNRNSPVRRNVCHGGGEVTVLLSGDKTKKINRVKRKRSAGRSVGTIGFVRRYGNATVRIRSRTSRKYGRRIIDVYSVYFEQVQ